MLLQKTPIRLDSYWIFLLVKKWLLISFQAGYCPKRNGVFVKKSGILSREISRVLATMGHYDFLVVADAGLPIPKDADCIDHLSIKDKVRTAKAVIRTGDFSPYSNTILSCGVSFSTYEQRITGK